MIQRLFVYGTLAPGRENHYMLEEVSGFWQPATLSGFLVDDGWGASMGYPGIIPSVEGKESEGVVYSSVALKGLRARIDAFEGNEYQRFL